MKRKRYNLTAEEKLKLCSDRQNLMADKEKVFLEKEWHGYCDNTEHPLFTIKVTIDKPKAVCYYCSKMYILKDS